MNTSQEHEWKLAESCRWMVNVQLHMQRVAHKRAREHQEDFYSSVKGMFQSVDSAVEL